jgi:lysophospholipase L1-like esterase
MSNPPGKKSFAVLGDSYAVGYGAAKGNGWVERLAAQMCWSMTNRSAQGGTGYTTAGKDPTYATFRERVSAVTGGEPDVLLIEGGTNDERAPSDEITHNATEVFNTIKSQVDGETTVVAIGPVMTPKKDATNLGRVSDAIARAATAVGVAYVDPIAEQWVADETMFFDAYHPNDAGYADFASHLARDLTALGATENCESDQS